MKLSSLLLFAAASLLLLTSASARTRPQYGGTLRVEMRAAPATLDPTESEKFGPNATAQSRLTPLVFDTLVTLNDNNQPIARLAIAWKHDAAYKQWDFTLRPGVTFSDDEPLTAATVSESLSRSGPGWKVRIIGDGVRIESEEPLPELLTELSVPRHAIVWRADKVLTGTGPFRIESFTAGQRAVFVANPSYWAGRPFVDRIEVQFNRNARDQQVDLQVGRADISEVPSDQLRRALSDSSLRAIASPPIELLAVVFDESRSKDDDARLREAIAATVDRNAIANLLLQRQAEPAYGLLPQWIGGYEHVFRASPDKTQRWTVKGAAATQSITLMYDFQDLAAKAAAERVVAGAREIGVPLQAVGENLAQREGNADMRVVRVAIPSGEAGAALETMAAELGLPAVSAAATIGQDYELERSLLESRRVIPVVHLPAAYSASARVRNWRVHRDGSLPLADLWLEAAP